MKKKQKRKEERKIKILSIERVNVFHRVDITCTNE